MEALQWSLLLWIAIYAGLPLPNEPIAIVHAPASFESDPLVRYDVERRVIVLGAAWDATNLVHQSHLVHELARAMQSREGRGVFEDIQAMEVQAAWLEQHRSELVEAAEPARADRTATIARAQTQLHMPAQSRTVH